MANIDLSKAVLGIELGSTRIKAVLIDEEHNPIASGGYGWENKLENGVWTYDLEEVHKGLKGCYRALAEDVQRRYGQPLRRVSAIGVSGMMHGYLAFDKDWRLLTPFRTWRNTITGPAAAELTELFSFNIPQRWSIAHLYQAILNDEPHVKDIGVLTTLSGYIHYLLTGRSAIGVNEASGMFPYDREAAGFDRARIAKFDKLIAGRGYGWKLLDILPEALPAGAKAGELTPAGAALLDDSGLLEPGIPMCPPEGDSGTGMVTTGCITPRTGSLSAGTSAFLQLVLEKELQGCYTEVDVVATPSGAPVAMVHTNTCTSDVDAWVRLFAEALEAAGQEADMNRLFPMLYRKALEGDADCGGMVSYNYYSGEPVAGIPKGRPMFIRRPDSAFTLANFMRSHLYGAVAGIKLGLDMLKAKERVETDRLLGHGGFFKVEGVGQQIVADALGIPVSAMETAGEGGPWGMALLAAYMLRRGEGESLEEYLDSRVFSRARVVTVQPSPEGVEGFGRYLSRYKACLGAEAAAAALE